MFTQKSSKCFTILVIALMLLTLIVSVTAQSLAEKPSIYADSDKSLAEVAESEPSESGFDSNLITSGTYGFLATTATLQDMSSGTTQIVAANVDDTASAVTNIGFDFWYDGARYTQFSCNANGVCRLGAAAVGTTFTNSLGSTTDAPKIAPYFDDLWVGTNGKVHYKVVGSAPNRVLVVEFLNMQVPRVGTGNLGAGTFQMWLYESAHTTTPGLIQFVYGSGMAANAANSGYSIGLQSGAATNFASVTTLTSTVSYVTANNAQTDAITSGTSYVFTPNIPDAAPSGLGLTPSTLSMLVSWTETATNEFGYAVERSTDGTNYSLVGVTAANAVSFNDTGLLPSTTYFYRVYTVTEGAVSSAISGSQATNAAGSDSCAGAGGNWSDTATWADSTVPTAGDNVTIGSGCTVTVDVTTAAALNVTIDSGGTLQSPLTGTVTTNNLTVGGSVTNNGTLDFSTNTNTSAAILTFGAGLPSVTFGGTGATTNIRTMTVAKGALANTVEMSPSNFTVQGTTTDGTPMAFLTLTSGVLKVSGSFTLTGRVFTTAGYTIGATAGLWLNNPNFTVAAQNGSPTVTGSFRMTQGTLNIGTGVGNSMGFSTGSSIIVEGGAINATGRFGVASSTNAISYTQSGGTITVGTLAHTSTTLASFDLGTSLSSVISVTGGTVIIQVASGAASGPRDYRMQSGGGVASMTGGTLQLGNASSGTAKIFTLRGVLPKTTNITNTSAGHTGQMDITLANYNNLGQDINIASGATFNTGNVIFLMAGNMVNDGTLTSTGASSRYYHFNNGVAQTYSGSGVVTAPMTSLDFGNALGVTLSSTNQLVVGRVIMFEGDVTGASKITLGNAGATTGVVQIGNTTTPTAAGTFDAPFTFNLGTGGQTISYLRTTLSRTTGGEVNPTRSLTSMTYDDNDITHTLTIAGGNLTVTGALGLTNGRVVTGANTLISGPAGTVTRTTGYVDGNLQRNFAVGAAVSRAFDVGNATYSPMTINFANVATAGDMLVTTTAGDHPSLGTSVLDPTKSVNRYWTATNAGVVFDTATVSMGWDAADNDAGIIPAVLQVGKFDGGTWTYPTPASPTATSIQATGVTSFSQFAVAQNLIVETPTSTNTATATGTATNTPTPGCGSGTFSYTAPVLNTVAIPDNLPAGVDVVIPVTGLGTVADLNFRFDGTQDNLPPATSVAGVSHSWVGDVKVTITAPGGQGSVVAFDRPGVPASTFGCSNNNIAQITLDDDGGFPAIETSCDGVGTAFPTGSFSPNNPLSAFDGINPNGDWVINFSDGGGGDTGYVNAVSLIIDGGCGTATATNTNTPTGTPSSTNTATETATATNTATQTNTATPTATATCEPLSFNFANPAAITINDNTTASPYPSDITVAGLTGNVYKVKVKLNGFDHTFPTDVDVLLVGPGGQNAVIMSDAGGTSTVTGVSFTLDSDAAATIPAPPVNGSTYKPTNVGVVANELPAPAPASAGGSSLATFVGQPANGTWSLYVADDVGGDFGSFAGGWELIIFTDAGPCATPTNTPINSPTSTNTATATSTATFTPTPPDTVCDLVEGFDDITNLPGWVQQNNSDPLGVGTYFQGNDTVFPSQAGAPTSYLGVNYQSGSGVATISNWMMTAPVQLQNGGQLTFWTRTTTASTFPDRLQVRMSTNGTSTNVGTLATDVGDFTTLLLDINPTYQVPGSGGYPDVWTQYTVTISGMGSPAKGRLAFRYFVENGGTLGANSDYIGIDTFEYHCSPATPTNTATATATETNTPTATPTTAGTPSVAGVVTYGNPASPTTKFISNATVSSTVGSPFVTTTTAAPGGTAGQYTLTGFGAGNYTVGVTKTTGQNGISSNDAARIAQHVAGTLLMTTDAQKVAADTSNNGTLSSNDAALLARFVAGLGAPIGITNTWRFFVPPGPTFPVGASPTTRSYTDPIGVQTGQDYIGLLIGETTGNWAAGPLRPANGPERNTAVAAPRLVTPADSEVIVPVAVTGAANKGIISYEFDLRYDPTVIQPQAEPVDLAGTASRGLTAVANANEPGLLRVVMYGAYPIDGNGLLLNLKFTAVGAPGTVSPLVFERMMFNEGDPGTLATDGAVELSASAPNQAELTGRVVNTMGQGMPNARVILTDTTTGATRSVMSNGFGAYRFGGLQVGQTYTISVESRHMAFTPLTVSITGQQVGVDMIAVQ